MKKVCIQLAAVACILSASACSQKAIEEAETTQEQTPKEEMPKVTVTDSTGKPISQDTATSTAASDQLTIPGK